jgi:hypothetical protein
MGRLIPVDCQAERPPGETPRQGKGPAVRDRSGIQSEPSRRKSVGEGEGEMTDDPNEAYEVMPIEPGPHGLPSGWWTVNRNGLPT